MSEPAFPTSPKSPKRAPAGRSAFACLVLALLVGSAGAPGVLGCGGSVEERLTEVRALQDGGDFSSSIEPLREILAEQPDHSESNYLLGLALVQTAQPTVAIWPLQKASSSEDFGIPAGLLLASTLITTGSYEEAVTAADRVLERDPTRSAALQLRANASLSSGKAEAALADADRLLEAEPESHPALVLRATSLQRLERFDEAEKAFRQLNDVLEKTGDPRLGARGCVSLANFFAEARRGDAEAALKSCIDKYPTDDVILQAATRYFDSKKRGEEVDALLRRAIEKEPDQAAFRFRLAERLVKAEKHDEARALLEETADLFDTPEAWSRVAAFEMQQGRYEEARAANQKAIDKMPQPSEELLFRQADILVQLGDEEAAEALASKFGVEPYRHLIRGRILYMKGDHEAALAALEQGLLRWPNNAAARFLAGQAAERLGDVDKAVSQYREAVRADASATDAALYAARLDLARGQPADAAEMARRHLAERDPKSPEAFLLRLRSLTLIGENEEARQTARAFAQLTDDPARGAVEVAAVERAAAGPAAAVRSIEKSGVDVGASENRLALRALVDHLVADGRHDAALARIDAALARDAGSAELHGLRGLVLLAAGRLAEARASAEKGLAAAPENATALQAAGRVAVHEGRLDDAIGLLDRAAAADPEDAESAYTAAQIQLSRGDAADAERRLQEVLARNPGHVAANNDLAWLLAERPDERERALRHAQRAARIDPRPEILDTLGWVQLQRGDPNAALEAFERSLAAKPDDPSIRYRYALALEALDRDEEALEALQRALQTGTFPELEQARAQVAKLESRGGAKP
jgi:tetratricopeptide (TPR) repeat protein